MVLAVAAAPAATGDLVENPAFRTRLGSGGRTVLLWAAILLAVVVLAFLTLRLARAPGAD